MTVGETVDKVHSLSRTAQFLGGSSRLCEYFTG